MVKHFKSSEGVIYYVEDILKNNDLKGKTQRNSLLMQKEFINPTDFLVWFIEKYPESKAILKNNPDYQNTFKER